MSAAGYLLRGCLTEEEEKQQQLRHILPAESVAPPHDGANFLRRRRSTASSDALAASSASIIDRLRRCGVHISDGLSNGEIRRIESVCSLTFPPDLRSLLQVGLPSGAGFPDWRLSSDDELRRILDLRHILGGGDSRTPAVSTILRRCSAAPTLLPVYAHFYIPSSPNLSGNPVFLISDSDVLVCSRDLADFFGSGIIERLLLRRRRRHGDDGGGCMGLQGGGAALLLHHHRNQHRLEEQRRRHNRTKLPAGEPPAVAAAEAGRILRDSRDAPNGKGGRHGGVLSSPRRRNRVRHQENGGKIAGSAPESDCHRLQQQQISAGMAVPAAARSGSRPFSGDSKIVPAADSYFRNRSLAGKSRGVVAISTSGAATGWRRPPLPPPRRPPRHIPFWSDLADCSKTAAYPDALLLLRHYLTVKPHIGAGSPASKPAGDPDGSLRQDSGPQLQEEPMSGTDMDNEAEQSPQLQEKPMSGTDIDKEAEESPQEIKDKPVKCCETPSPLQEEVREPNAGSDAGSNHTTDSGVRPYLHESGDSDSAAGAKPTKDSGGDKPPLRETPEPGADRESGAKSKNLRWPDADSGTEDAADSGKGSPERKPNAAETESGAESKNMRRPDADSNSGNRSPEGKPNTTDRSPRDLSTEGLPEGGGHVEGAAAAAWLGEYFKDVEATLRRGGWKEEEIEEMVSTAADTLKVSEENAGVRGVTNSGALFNCLQNAGWSVQDALDALGMDAQQIPNSKTTKKKARPKLGELLSLSMAAAA